MKKETKRYWLTFNAAGVRRPLICEMSRKYDVIFDIRHANVTPEMGLMAIELKGDPKVIEGAVAWLKKKKVQVDPI